MTLKEKLYDKLELDPGNWDVRIQLIEMAVVEGNMPTAKRLVRASPGNLPTPPEIQVRLHSLLTGNAGVHTAPPAHGPEVVPAVVAPEPGAGVSIDPGSPLDDPRGDAPMINEELLTSDPTMVRDEPRAEMSCAVRSPFDELGGGLSALVETDDKETVERQSSSRRKKAPEVKREAIREKWANYDGGLELATLDLRPLADLPSLAPERFSALTLALLVHLVVFILVGLVVIQIPRPAPPQLVVSVAHERETELVTTRLTRPTLEIMPTAAAAQAVDVISSISASSFDLPDVDEADSMNALSMTAGIELVGTGMSFTTDNMVASDVNFFGLSGSGKKIVFVIDATQKMLVDEKGGMTAYDNVKTEVSIMLANLNRGTHFNILLYDGKRLVAFRDELVPGLPSNIRLAIDWLGPLNRDYESLGLGVQYGESLSVSDDEKSPIQAVDVAHYTKAIQKAMEWQASSIFCIVSGYENMNRSPTPEMRAKMGASSASSAPDPPQSAAWERAVERTREWLAKENEARQEKGLAPKVVPNFNQLVREITGATPPQRNRPNNDLPPVTPEDVEDQIVKVVKSRYKAEGIEEPSLHMVLFLGEDETIDQYEGHFRDITQKNKGKLKVLRGLAALKNVTGK